MERKVRKPEYAGLYYPSNADELRSQIEITLAKAGSLGPDLSEIQVTAMISPSVGFSYGAKVALAGYQKLMHRDYTRVVLIGASHFFSFDGIGLTEINAYETPFGEVELDLEAVQKLKNNFLFQAQEKAFIKEYSLEIQLPYLQYFLGEFKLLPLMLGSKMNLEETAAALGEFADEKTLFVLSCNLSHFHTDAKARIVDQKTIDALLYEDAKTILAEGQASAVLGIALLNELSLLKNWQPLFLSYGNSAEAGDNPDSVVGYASLIYIQE